MPFRAERCDEVIGERMRLPPQAARPCKLAPTSVVLLKRSVTRPSRLPSLLPLMRYWRVLGIGESEALNVKVKLQHLRRFAA